MTYFLYAEFVCIELTKLLYIFFKVIIQNYSDRVHVLYTARDSLRLGKYRPCTCCYNQVKKQQVLVV